ncbi:MAG: 7TM domain-containing protein [bacterium]
MSTLINQLTTNLQLDNEVILLLLFLPFIVTIISIGRYLIGIKTIGIYAPIIMTLMFFTIGYNPQTEKIDILSALVVGFSFLLVIIFSTIFSYRIIKKWVLHYFAKLAIVITIEISLLFLILILLAQLGKTDFINVNVYLIVLIATLSERILNLFAFNKQEQAVVILISETMLLSSITFLIMCVPPIQHILLKFPYIVLINLPLNYFFGKFTGLRLSEYYRFREILKK